MNQELLDFAKDSLRRIKKYCWDIQSGHKMLSVSALLSSMEEPFDQSAAAAKAAANPSHTHYGKTVEEIIKIWNTKTAYAGKTGMGLDDYAQSVFDNKTIPHETITDANLKAKCIGFDKLNKEIIQANNIVHVGYEVWIASKHKYRGKTDWIGAIEFKPGRFGLIIFDWKQNEKIDTRGYFGKTLKAPFDYMQDCKLTKFTNQVHLYRYVINEEIGIPVVGSVIGHVKPNDYAILNEAHKYDPKIIEQIVENQKNK